MKPRVVHGKALSEFSTPENCSILELWNTTDDPAVSIARARVLPGEVTALHRLTIDERYVILEGKGRVEVEGLPAVDVGPGDIVAIPAMAAQRIANIGGQDLLFYCVCSPRFIVENYREVR
jgi:mannose-6-phosphate isomerase-like protein (cupin superfamily)